MSRQRHQRAMELFVLATDLSAERIGPFLDKACGDDHQLRAEVDRQIRKTKAGVVTNFVYDVRDQLSAVQQAGASLGRYGYDYQGLRVSKDGQRTYLTSEESQKRLEQAQKDVAEWCN